MSVERASQDFCAASEELIASEAKGGRATPSLANPRPATTVCCPASLHRLESLVGEDDRRDPKAELVADLHRLALSDAAIADAQVEHLFTRFVEVDDRSRAKLDDLANRLLLG